MQRKPNDQFIQAYSDEFSEKVVQDFFDDKDTISGKEILSVSPSKQVNFFILKILFKKWQDEMKQLESPYFNYKDNDVRRAMVQFMNTLSQNIEMGENELQSLMKEAVIETISLSISPLTYLQSEFENKKFDILSEKIYKPYLKYLRIRKEEFSAFFSTQEGNGYDEVIGNATDFFDDDEVYTEIELMSRVVPISLEEIYYQEKEDDVIQPVIEEEELDIQTEEIVASTDDEQGELASIEPESFAEADREVEDNVDIEDVDEAEQEELSESVGIAAESRSEESEAYDVPTEEDTPEEIIDEVREDAQVDEDISDDTEVTVDEQPIVEEDTEESVEAIEREKEEEAFKEEIEEQSDADEEYVDMEEVLSNTDAPSTLNDQYQADDKETLAEQHTHKKVESILEAISVNHRYMFTKELFDGDRDAFQDAIAKIEDSSSFDDAVELIVQTYAKELSWDMNSDEVKELLKVVFRKFR